MQQTWLKSFSAVCLSFALGIIFNFLFFYQHMGISVFVFALVFLASIFWFGFREKSYVQKNWWLVILILFFALMPSVRANEFLNFLNICAVLGLFMLLAQELTGTSILLMKFRDYLTLLFRVPFRMLRGAWMTLAVLGNIPGQHRHTDIWLRVLKGALMAVPILIFFGVLFSGADFAFSQFLEKLIHLPILPEYLREYIMLFLPVCLLALAFLSYLFFPQPTRTLAALEPKNATAPPERGIETMVFLGLISALFAVFIGFQITYLFGGEAHIVNAGFTYAEYARNGFGELLVVGIFSLLILLAAEKYVGLTSRSDRRFLIPALILIAEVAMVIISALKRLSLYIDAYGMTTSRFYAATFVFWLLVLFIVLTIKLIRSKPESFFASSSLITVALFLVGINVSNPDAFIAQTNMRKYERTGTIDLSHMSILSVDAEPWKIALYKKLEGEEKDRMRRSLEYDRDSFLRSSQHASASGSHWQGANLARTQAWKMLQNFGE